MSNKKMLTESTVRRFMKLAKVDSLSDNFINETYGSPMEEDEDTNEGHCMEEDMMDVSEEDGSLEAGFEDQAYADGIEAMEEVDYTAHGEVDEGMFDEDIYDEGMEEGMFDEDMYGEGVYEGDYFEEDVMEEEDPKLDGEEVFMTSESIHQDPSVAWLFEQEEEDEPIEDEEDEEDEEGENEEDIPMDDEEEDMGDPEEDMPMGEADISLTEEEAQLLISLGERLKEAMEEGDEDEPMSDMPADEPAGEEAGMTDPDDPMSMPAGEEDEPMDDDQEEVIQEILRRVTKRIMNKKLSRK